jgi:glucose-6-phosphate-specific signal transduction histidine kinase
VNVFEFLLALYSIIAGLGLSLLVRSIGQMIEARSRVRLYWVHSCLIVVAFVGQVVSWFSLWQFSGHSPWTVAETLALLSVPLLLYLVSHLVVPELDDGLAHDLREYYYRHARWTHGLLLTIAVISLAGEAFILGHFDLTPPRMLRLTFAAVLLPGVLSANPAIHSAQAIALMALVATGVTLIRLPIG